MGNWIKMRHDLYDDPDVRRVARATGLDRDQVVGKLFRLWSWADRHGVNGLVSAEIEDLDDQVGHVGFGAALVSVGWLGTPDGGIEIPHWDRHFSDSAKVRGLAGQRAEKHRSRQRNATRVTDPPDGVTQGALPDKNKNRGDIPPPPPRDAAQDQAALRAAWAKAAKAGKVQPYRAKSLPPALAERLAEPGWLDEALLAIEHLPRCRFFSTPATLFQLVGAGFVQRVLAGQYDDPKPAKGARGPAGATEDRRTADEAAREWQRGANDPERQAAREAYLKAKAAKEAKAAGTAPGLPDPGVPEDFDLERDRVALIQHLRKAEVA
jgi:hypothetical protein